MDEPARKRRRTISPGGSERPSSPLKKPPRRPSFASPTKASLARFNPNLLSDSATPKQSSRLDILNRGKQARAFIFGGQEEEPRELQNEEDQVAAGAEQPRALQDRPIAHPPRRSSVSIRRSVPLGDVDEEAELPATPSKAMEQDSPRRGVLFSSPSKRPPRLREATKQSPLKPRQPEHRGAGIGTGADLAAEEEQLGKAAEKEKKTTPDPELERKKREKEKLLRELRELEDDVAQYDKKIQYLNFQSSTGPLSSGQQDAVISLINGIERSDASMEEAPPISSLLCSFLPFTAQVVPQPKTNQTREEPVPSHRPIDLEDPLPYLEMFTPCKFTSKITIPGEYEREYGDVGTRQLHQTHEIEMVAPLKLFLLSVFATVDTTTQQVVNIRLGRVTGWADRGDVLVKFMHEKAKQKDLSCIFWAASSFFELAKKRAEYWKKVVTAFPHLIPGHPNEDRENIRPSDGKPTDSMSRQDYLQYLGVNSMVLEDRHMLLKINWRIGFDWTGEAESEIFVEPAYPRVWSEADSNGSLRKIPETFDSLLQSRGVFEATKAMVALLFRNSE